MSLFSREEICSGCMYSIWHVNVQCDDCIDRGGHFCHCTIDIVPDFCSKDCPNYTLNK